MSPICRAAGAPAIITTDRMRELDGEADKLQAELERLRHPGAVAIFPPATARVRELRRLLAALELKLRDEFERANPKWVQYWSAA